MNANHKTGMLSIESKNIFSILKKWLYTEQDIVFRELVSNAADAVEKLAQLREADTSIPMARGEIHVLLDADTHRLIIRDNGIGMTREELDKYINHIAFSGAEDFIQRNNQAGKDTIIGHFGVGFYSAFMLSEHVSIETKSYQPEAPTVRWDCLADMSFSMEPGDKADTGTDVILNLPESSPYFAKPELVLDILKKYFLFAKTPIFYTAPDHEEVLVNPPSPWRTSDNAADSEEMRTFYKDFFGDADDPLFWVPFESADIGVRGILFFRNTRQGTNELDGSIKVYSRGVYVGENIPQLVPKFVALQNGIVECDDLPLVVSRSTLREEEQRENIGALVSECLSQEVAIALHDMFENRRSQYEAYWPELNAFVKYGILQDKVFSSVMSRRVIFLDIYGTYRTVQEYAESDGVAQKILYYASDRLDQAHFIEIFKTCGLNALLFDHVIDQPLLFRYETLFPKLRFLRIDANFESIFQDAMVVDEPGLPAFLEKVTKALGERLGETTLKCARLAHANISVLMYREEQQRRLVDMMEIYGLIGADDESAKEKQAPATLLLNLNNPIVRFIEDSNDDAVISTVANQLFDLALMSQQALKPEDMESFLIRSEAILAASLQ